MRASTKFSLILALFFLLFLAACAGGGPAEPATAGAEATLEALPPAPEQTAPAAAAQPADDAGAGLEVTEEPPAAEAPSPEPAELPTELPTEPPTEAPTATPQIVMTQTGEAPTPQATVTPEAAAEETVEVTEEAGDEEPAATGTPIDETVTGIVLGNSGTTADLVERGISLDVTGLAKTYAWVVVPISDTVENPLPRHILLTFDEDDPEEMMAEDGRRLYVFPLRPYLALYPVDGQSDVDAQVARLNELIETAAGRRSGADVPPGDWMPLLPLLEDDRLLAWEQFADVDFASGRGVRFLSDYSGVPTYTYQGLSEGDRYYLSLFWPLAGEGAPDVEKLDALVASFAIGERGE
ncbi:MAG: hypothetical protein ACK2UK_11540 [Candidatus Promineifilaceae bacterium]